LEIWSGMNIPDPDLDFLPIPDAGSRGQIGTGTWIRVRNTGGNQGCESGCGSALFRKAGSGSALEGKLDSDPLQSQSSGAVEASKMEPWRAVDAHSGAVVAVSHHWWRPGSESAVKLKVQMINYSYETFQKWYWFFVCWSID
jgi:hypothetical protein